MHQSNYTRSRRSGSSRSGTVHALYWSPEWKALRLQALQQANWRCENCGWDVSGRGQAHADHIEDVKSRPDLALALSNIRILCRSCHNASHDRKHGTRPARIPIKGCDIHGMPLDPEHPWNVALRNSTSTDDAGGRTIFSDLTPN
jgi:5-methylcytosine-specific restriction endonuclease McrA